MKYLEITVITTTAAAEIAADILSGEGSPGIGIVDKSDFLELSKKKNAWDYVEDGLLEKMGDFARVSGFFDLGRRAEVMKNVTARLEELKGGGFGIDFGPLEIIPRVIDDNDWIGLAQKHFKPITVKGVTVVPEWLAGKAGGEMEGRRVLLNPGMAFGTGEHETTAGCIELLQSVELAGRSVIDLGCGSGILGITAAVLGAAKITMIDIDPLAVKASLYNVKINADNGLDTAGIEVMEGDLFAKAGLNADVIAANLASDLLISAAKDITAHLRPGGTLILSGIIESRFPSVRKAYEDILGADAVDAVLRRGEWVAFSARKK